MTGTPDEQKAQWITAAGEAFIAIRLVTGYGRRMAQPLDEDTAYAVTQLADMLHNIGLLAAGDGTTTLGFNHHSPEKLERVRASTDALFKRYREGLPRLRSRQYVYVTAKGPGMIARIVRAIAGK